MRNNFAIAAAALLAATGIATVASANIVNLGTLPVSENTLKPPDATPDQNTHFPVPAWNWTYYSYPMYYGGFYPFSFYAPYNTWLRYTGWGYQGATFSIHINGYLQGYSPYVPYYPGYYYGNANYAWWSGYYSGGYIFVRGGSYLTFDAYTLPNCWYSYCPYYRYYGADGALSASIGDTSASSDPGIPPDDFDLGQIALSRVVPEPASWAMMIAGFALVGHAMRRRRYYVLA